MSQQDNDDPDRKSRQILVTRVSERMLPVRATRRKKEAETGKPSAKTIIIALVVALVDFGIAQFGLLPLIQKGYSFIAYLAIPVILLPYIIHMIVTKWDTKELPEALR